MYRTSSCRSRVGSACALKGCARHRVLTRAAPSATTQSGLTASAEATDARSGTGQSSGDDTSDRSHDTEVVVIGAGIGGLCCAALLSHYGLKVTVVEAHYHPGGAAHGFDIKTKAGTYNFDAGPSFHAGLSESPSSNPLKQLLDIIGEEVSCETYDRWIVYDDKGSFPCIASAAGYREQIREQGGPEAYKQWLQLEETMKPMQAGAGMFPAAAMRDDLGALLTVGVFGIKAGWVFAETGMYASKLAGPFSGVVDEIVTDPWLRNFIDLECFVLSGMLAKDTVCGEMAFMFMERNKPTATIDYPLGGSAALVDALVRGVTKNGGRVVLRAAVDEILMEGGRAVGVQLKQKPGSSKAEVIRASKAVVSNASIWDTQRLLPPGAAPADWAQKAWDTPAIESFMHLHLGIDATGLPEDLQVHHLIVNDWDNLKGTQNVILVSIPSMLDSSLAPEGKAVVHVYAAANEPWENWEGVERGSEAYKQLKEERSQNLWTALERVIPDVRERVDVAMVGTPLTHQHFLRRHKGTYGPGISAASAVFPRATTPIPGLLGCGDSYLPGIGVPAAAASGMIAANTLVSVPSHLKVLREIDLV